MVKDETFTLYNGLRTKSPVESVDDDLESGTYGDEESLPRVAEANVPGRFTEQTYHQPEAQYVLYLPSSSSIQTDWRVKRNKTGTIYVVGRVIRSKLAGSDLIVELRE